MGTVGLFHWAGENMMSFELWSLSMWLHRLGPALCISVCQHLAWTELTVPWRHVATVSLLMMAALPFQSQVLWDPWAPVQTWPSLRTIPLTISPENGTEMASRNPDHNYMNLLRGRTPASWGTCTWPRSTGRRARGRSSSTVPRPWVHVLRLWRLSKSKIPKGGCCTLSQMTYIAHP